MGMVTHSGAAILTVCDYYGSPELARNGNPRLTFLDKKKEAMNPTLGPLA